MHPNKLVGCRDHKLGILRCEISYEKLTYIMQTHYDNLVDYQYTLQTNFMTMWVIGSTFTTNATALWLAVYTAIPLTCQTKILVNGLLV